MTSRTQATAAVHPYHPQNTCSRKRPVQTAPESQPGTNAHLPGRRTTPSAGTDGASDARPESSAAQALAHTHTHTLPSDSATPPRAVDRNQNTHPGRWQQPGTQQQPRPENSLEVWTPHSAAASTWSWALPGSLPGPLGSSCLAPPTTRCAWRGKRTGEVIGGRTEKLVQSPNRTLSSPKKKRAVYIKHGWSLQTGRPRSLTQSPRHTACGSGAAGPTCGGWTGEPVMRLERGQRHRGHSPEGTREIPACILSD